MQQSRKIVQTHTKSQQFHQTFLQIMVKISSDQLTQLNKDNKKRTQ